MAAPALSYFASFFEETRRFTTWRRGVNRPQEAKSCCPARPPNSNSPPRPRQRAHESLGQMGYLNRHTNRRVTAQRLIFHGVSCGVSFDRDFKGLQSLEKKEDGTERVHVVSWASCRFRCWSPLVPRVRCLRAFAVTRCADPQLRERHSTSAGA